MISPARITALLSRQEALSPEDKRQLEQVVVRFPFFVPAQLLLAAQRPLAAQSLQSLYLNPVLTASHLPAVRLRQSQPLPIVELPVDVEEKTDANSMIGGQEAEGETETVFPPQAETGTEEALVTLSEETVLEAMIPPAEEESKPVMKDEPVENSLDTLAETEKRQAVQNPEFSPVYTEDYFRYEGIKVTSDLPAEDALQPAESRQASLTGEDHDKDKSLMVMMSFTDWLMHYRKKSQSAKDEEADQQRVKSAWQREKLAAALQEEDDEIPEQVFEMAVNSLNQEDGLVSESLAAILARQGKTEKAIEMYQKLSLKYPQKSAYFASQIENLKRGKNQ